jgi:phage-related protein
LRINFAEFQIVNDDHLGLDEIEISIFAAIWVGNPRFGFPVSTFPRIAWTSYRILAILTLADYSGSAQIKEVAMPRTEVVFFAEEDSTAPLLVWLDQQETKVQDKCLVKIDRLEELGYELRRPEADYLHDGIYELRVRYRSVNYRMLYFFHEGIAVVSHGLTKEDVVPDRDISLAASNMAKFKHDPDKHTYKE